jgi:transcription antitermination factor NusB
MIDRRRARILAMQALCQLEVLGTDWLGQMDEFLADEGDTAAVQDYARGLIKGIWPDLAVVDEPMQSASEHWDLKRMTVVDRNILRVAIRELLNADAAVPPRVALDEAIEIGKIFGGAESPAFINGVLDHVMKAVAPGAELATNQE